MKRILIIATRQIGDTLITTPLIEATHRLWPQAKIDFFGYSASLPMLFGNPHLDRLIGSSTRPRWGEYLKQFFQLFRRYDLAIITQPSDRAYIYGLLAAKQIVGVVPSEEKHNWWKKKCALHTVEVDYFGQHVIAEKLRLLLPFTSEKNLFESPSGVRVLPPAIAPLPEWLGSQLKQDFVVIHPSPLTAYKRWPLFHWVQLIEHLSSKYQVILSGAPIAQDLELNAEIMSQLSEGARSQVLNLEGRLALNQLGTLLRSARLYIGVDTSVTHLAAACDIPTITLFGATPPTNFGPWPNGFKGDQPYQLRGTQKVGLVTIVQGPGDCVPCRKAGCEDRPDSKSECLMNLSVAQVIEAIEAYRLN